MIDDRHQRLRTQTGRTTVPEERVLPGQVEQRHRIAIPHATVYTDAETPGIRQRRIGLVTRGTRNRPVT